MTNDDKIFEYNTRINKLDTMLYGFIFLDKLILEGKTPQKKITIEFLNDALKLDCEKWEMLSLKNELLAEGYIIEMSEELRITENGKRFITREGGFKNLVKSKKEEELIRRKTIEKFKYDKFSFWLSVLAIVIAGLSLYVSIIYQ